MNMSLASTAVMVAGQWVIPFEEKEIVLGKHYITRTGRRVMAKSINPRDASKTEMAFDSGNIYSVNTCNGRVQPVYQDLHDIVYLITEGL